jgi:hypothetical protein
MTIESSKEEERKKRLRIRGTEGNRVGGEGKRTTNEDDDVKKGHEE